MTSRRLVHSKIITKYHTSNDLVTIQDGDYNIQVGYTGFSIALSLNDLTKLNTEGYVHTNNEVNTLPSIPVVSGNRIMVLSTSSYQTRLLHVCTPNDPPPAAIQNTVSTILQAYLTKQVNIPTIVNVDMSKAMVPVITDSTGKTYMSTSKHKVLYVDDPIEAQATIMASTIPFPEHLVDKGKAFITASTDPDTHKPGEYFIFLKDKFIDVFEQ